MSLSLVQKLFIVHISGATCPREMQVQFCEDDSLSLSCASVLKKIKILSANYGRLTGAQVCGWGAIYTTNWKANGALAKVQGHCQGRSHCTLRATNSEFGDPCHGTYKYLEVTIFLSQTFSQPGFKGISFLQFLIVARIRSFGKLIDLEKEVVAWVASVEEKSEKGKRGEGRETTGTKTTGEESIFSPHLPCICIFRPFFSLLSRPLQLLFYCELLLKRCCLMSSNFFPFFPFENTHLPGTLPFPAPRIPPQYSPWAPIPLPPVLPHIRVEQKIQKWN